MEKSLSKASMDALHTEDSNYEENDRLKFWQDRYADCLNSYSTDLSNIDNYFAIYNGSGETYGKSGKAGKSTNSVRKVAFELVESQADVSIPMPKVTSLNGNEGRAMTIENFVRNEIDKLDLEDIADEQARTVPIAGAGFWLVEWDNSVITRNTIGKISVRNLDPKNVIPQKGVYHIDDMDYIFVRLEQSKDEIKRRYKIDIKEIQSMSQDDPNMDLSNNDELVTHVYCYYKDHDNNISLMSWVDDIVINDYDNYFSRKQSVCTKCDKRQEPDAEKCECGNDKFKLIDLMDEKVRVPKQTEPGMEDTGEPVMTEIDVPYYIPKSFPIIKRVNITKRDSFLGISDVEMVKDQQNDLNIYMRKIKDKMLMGGSVMTLPSRVNFKPTDEEFKIVRVNSEAEKNLIDIKTLQPNVQNDIGLLSLNYDIARQTIGVTNSYQGREDSSALSGKAKEASVSQVEGRFEPKKSMKNKAYADLFWVMFQFMLAYADEPRNIYYQDEYGKMQYKMFDKRMFIDKDQKTNKYYYDDEFAFATDISSTLANNRQLMWQETRNNFSTGAYGDPSDINTIVMYWQMMETLHYPGATTALQFATRRLEEQKAAQAENAKMQQEQLRMQVASAEQNSQAKMMDSQSKMMAAKAKTNENNGTKLMY